MARRTILRQRAWGESILERLDGMYVPQLAQPVRAFRKAQARLASATRRARAAREQRDAALAALGRADGAVERALAVLATRLVAAGLGTRKNPLAGRPAKTPAQLAALEPPKQTAEIARLVARFKGQRVTPAVQRALAKCASAASALSKASARVAKTQRIYAGALASRDALLDAWTTALARLERRAKEIWKDEPHVAAEVFAPLDEDEPRDVLDLRPALPNVMNGVHTS